MLLFEDQSLPQKGDESEIVQCLCQFCCQEVPLEDVVEQFGHPIQATWIDKHALVRFNIALLAREELVWLFVAVDHELTVSQKGIVVEFHQRKANICGEPCQHFLPCARILNQMFWWANCSLRWVCVCIICEANVPSQLWYIGCTVDDRGGRRSWECDNCWSLECPFIHSKWISSQNGWVIVVRKWTTPAFSGVPTNPDALTLQDFWGTCDKSWLLHHMVIGQGRHIQPVTVNVERYPSIVGSCVRSERIRSCIKLLASTICLLCFCWPLLCQGNPAQISGVPPNCIFGKLSEHTWHPAILHLGMFILTLNTMSQFALSLGSALLLMWEEENGKRRQQQKMA